MTQTANIDPQGVVKDTSPHDVGDEWTDAQNMRFTNGRSQKYRGEDLGTTTPIQAEHLLFNGRHESPLWFYMGDAELYQTNFVDPDDDLDTGNNITSSVNWDACLFNLKPVFNNTVDIPWVQAAEDDQVTPLPDLSNSWDNWTCQSIRPFRSFLIAMNITDTGVQDGNRLIWSDSSDAGALPATWDIADPTTLAGDAYLTSTKGEIVDGAQLRDLFVIYKTHSCYIMQLTNLQSVMKIQRVQLNSGILAKNCVTEFKGRHFVVADGDVVLFDGQNIESIAEDRVRKQIFGEIDETYFYNTYVVRYDRHNEIWVCYPSGSEHPNRCAIWNWRDNTWTFRDIQDARHIDSGLANFAVSDTWAAATYTWASATYAWRPIASNPTTDTLVSATTGQLNIIDQTLDINGSPMPSKLEKQSMDFGKPEQVKLINKIIPRITADAGTKVYIRIGFQMDSDDPVDWSLPEQLYTVGTDREISTIAKGRFISVRLRTQDLNTAWALHQVQFVFREAGRF